MMMYKTPSSLSISPTSVYRLPRSPKQNRAWLKSTCKLIRIICSCPGSLRLTLSLIISTLVMVYMLVWIILAIPVILIVLCKCFSMCFRSTASTLTVSILVHRQVHVCFAKLLSLIKDSLFIIRSVIRLLFMMNRTTVK